uniref:Uncharacterized protein n=1 Tax=Arundo donax TaxID=35708 RepID=A0A0A9BPB7_ARUDO
MISASIRFYLSHLCDHILHEVFVRPT